MAGVPWEISGRKDERSRRRLHASIFRKWCNSGHPLMEHRNGIVGCVTPSPSWSVDTVSPTTIVTMIVSRNGRSGDRHAAVAES